MTPENAPDNRAKNPQPSDDIGDSDLKQILSSPEFVASLEAGVADVKAGRVTRIDSGQSLSEGLLGLTGPSRPSQE